MHSGTILRKFGMGFPFLSKNKQTNKQGDNVRLTWQVMEFSSGNKFVSTENLQKVISCDGESASKINTEHAIITQHVFV